MRKLLILIGCLSSLASSLSAYGLSGFPIFPWGGIFISMIPTILFIFYLHIFEEDNTSPQQVNSSKQEDHKA